MQGRVQNQPKSMASSSTTTKYDVFVSFRGEDTRNNFADHLFAAFRRNGIVAFRDDRNLMQGQHISIELMQAIEESQVLIVIFSKNYANSSWCLQELAKMLDCSTKVTRPILLPIFYDVSPSEFRQQTGVDGKALVEHEERFKHELVQQWRDALVQVANLFGWDIQNKQESVEIEKIVKKDRSILSSNSLSVDGLVGMESRVEELENLIDFNSNREEVRVVGICGMGGIGKSILARVIYGRNLHQYSARCFVDDISKVFREDCLLSLQKQFIHQYSARLAVIQAAKMGIPEFIMEVTKKDLYMFWPSEEITKNPIFVGVEYRQAIVFDLIHGMIWKNALAAEITNNKDGNTLLHMAALLAPSAQLHHTSGAALQMQRELHWFKEVQSITPASRKQFLNDDKKTARELFTEEHKDLVKQGEKWMKGTATSFSLVAALVATVVFAAAFTVPGGNDQITGYPIFSRKKAFKVFVVSDAVSFFSSSTSIIMFVGILTSHYAEDDFLKALPLKLIIGLLTFFISMASKLVAFSAALFVMLRGRPWIVVPVSLLAWIPVASFVWLQFPLFVEITMSTFGPSIFDRNADKNWLTTR